VLGVGFISFVEHKYLSELMGKRVVCLPYFKV
jgi:hypothetical protein